MKTAKILIKLAAAVAAIAGIAYLVVKYMDKITEWLNKVCPACPFCKDEPEVEPVDAEVDVAAEEPAAPADPVETPDVIIEDIVITPASDATAPSPITEDAPVAEAEDFDN